MAPYLYSNRFICFTPLYRNGVKKDMARNIKDVVSDRLTEAQTTSEDRRQYLERLAQLMTRHFTPTVQFTNIKTARCRHNDGDITIDIGAEVVNQTVTNLPKRIWTLLAQEGLITHEIGHVLYTDFEAHESIKDDLGMKEMNAFHDIVWNPAEDAAIEEQLRWKFNCGQELDTYNANLFESQKNSAKMLPVPQAIKIAILEKGCYDAGAVEDHLNGKRQLVKPEDEEVFEKLLQEVNAMLSDVMTEADPEVRYERMLEFWNLLKDEMKDQGKDAESEHQDGQGQGYDDAKPDDTSGMTEGDLADALEDLDSEDVEEQLQQTAAPQDYDWDEFDEDEESEDESDDVGGGETGGEPMESEDDQSPSDENQTGQSGGEDAEQGQEQDTDDADESGSGDTEGGQSGNGNSYPGHTGHHLVIKD